MNNNIKTILDECTDKNMTKPWPLIDAEKFAELLIKEVSSFVSYQRNDIPCTGDEMADTIRFYYGIK